MPTHSSQPSHSLTKSPRPGLPHPCDAMKRRRSIGQGMTEYILIVALMAIAAIGVVTLLGDNVRKLFGQAAEALTGNPNVANDAAHRRKELEEKGLQGFGENNSYR